MALLVVSCASEKSLSNAQSVETLITGGLVYSGEEADRGERLDIGVANGEIVFVGNAQTEGVSAEKIVDARNLIVAPGFIDPHTHALEDLLSENRSMNANYLTQGVTTVLAGNDGAGPVDIGATLNTLNANNTGTNVALFVGHNSVRKSVVGDDDRLPTALELTRMRELVDKAMKDGAIGLSSGLYYAPGSFAGTEELVELMKVVQAHGGIYDTHIRDESSYSIGLLAAVSEALEIGEKSGAPVHIAHIKALGVDVWGQSADVIELIEKARLSGQQVTADQYPWAASGTRISNALIPNWAKAGSMEDMYARLRDASLQSNLNAEIKENLRKRGGAEALLIVSGNEAWTGKTLQEISEDMGVSPVEAAVAIVLDGDARVASFNMQERDIEAFMKQPWVATSSDGTKGHPRKYGSFPRKYRHYVVEEGVISLGDFIRRSSGLPADIFGLCARGYIREGYAADIVIFDPETFRENATFSEPERASSGVIHLYVNGRPAIENGKIAKKAAGRAVRRGACKEQR